MKPSGKVKICYVVAVDITIRLITINYLRRAKQAGYEVWIVCSPSPLLAELEREGFFVKPILISRRIKPLADLIALLVLWRFFKQERFDVVQVQTPKAAFLGQLAAMAAGVPIIINNNFGFYFENFGRVKKAVFVFCERLAASKTSLMFTINKEDAKTAVSEQIMPAGKIQYLGFGIDTSRFDPAKFSESFITEKKRQLGILPGQQVVGIIARLVKEKGYLELFEAFTLVLQTFPNTILLIMGSAEPEKKDGIDISITREYGIEKNVIFLGQRSDIEELYPVMDIFVLPTHREGLGNTILEASAMERPVVASNVRGPRESVDDKKTGLLFEVKNAKAMAEAICQLLQNPVMRREFGQAGRKKVLQEFTEEKVFAVMKNAYEALQETI